MAEKKRVNLGSGTDYLPGWINVDVEEKYRPDILADLRKKFPFEDNSIDEIIASDILEHFTKEDGRQFLKECHRILKKNERISIRTHNIFQIFEQFQDDPEVMIHFLYGNTEESGAFGAHKYAYTEDSIRRALKLIGFSVEKIERETTNFFIVARKVEQKDKDKKLTIGIIQQTPDMGGAEMYMLSLMKEFQKKGNILILASNLEPFLNEAKSFTVQSYKLPFVLDIIGNWKGLVKGTALLPRAIFFYARLLQKLRREKVDVILMSGFSEKLLVTFLSQFFRIPVVWIEYSPLETVFRRNFYIPKVIYRLFKDIPKVIIVPTQNTKQSLITHARVSLAKIQVIPCGVKVLNERVDGKMLFKNVKKPFVVGNISRLTTEKGQDVLIKAAPLILKKNPNVRFLLVGDGPDRGLYEQLTRKLGISDKFAITGYVDNVSPYYGQMDIFVFPTVWELEGFGLVLVEAMSRKIPVIASNLGPVPEIVQDSVNGLLVKAGDEKALALAVNKLIEDEKTRGYLAQKGQYTARKLYDINKISKQIAEVLKDATL